MAPDTQPLVGAGQWISQQIQAQRQTMSPLTILLGCVGLLALVYVTYRQALPKPIPGIPYNEEAAKSLVGDMPLLIRHLRNRDIRALFSEMTTRHNSPIVQTLGHAGQKPTVIISDFVTSQEILLRRSKEFDRPPGQLAQLRGVVPDHHISKLTSDPGFRKNKELVKDLMTPNFLHTVNAPEIWWNSVQFVELWKAKARIADGRPFEAAEDIARMTLDIIRNVAVGKSEDTLIGAYLEQIHSELGTGPAASASAASKDTPFQFPKPPRDDTMEAQHRMNQAITPAVPIPPKLFHAINNRTRHMREAYAWKDQLLRKQVAVAVKRMEAGEPLESALDYMVQRELGLAKKQQRAPVYDSKEMFDELYGYIGAGHETTATTFEWGVKHLAQHPEVQRKTRDNLRAVYKDAHEHRRQPSIAEIIKTPVPWLEAVVEEILRVSGPVGATARETTVDTVILGRRVPKGTTVFLTMHGPGFTAPSVVNKDAAAGVGPDGGKPQQTYTKRGTWDGLNPEAFEPERWLEEDQDGNLVYNSQAGPMLSFSLGIRGCFGKRLAYLTLRALFTMLIWNFELEAVPEELDSWKAVQILTMKTVQCYVRLREAP